jgi:DNA polymerase alpha-associated DNA helicase A
MQLPPTILSLDHKKKEEKPALRSKVAKKDAELSQASRGSDENSDSETSSNEGGLPNSVAQMSISSEQRVVLVPPRTLETTLFDRLEKMYGTSIKKMLEIQYR